MLVAALAVPGSARADDCGNVPADCGVTADQGSGVFHGLIAVTDQGWVLDVAGRSGTESGCGDCVWTVVLACPTNTPTGDQTKCVVADSPVCQPGQLLYRLYLSTRAETDVLEGTVCLGGTSSVVPISADAAADVDRYLRDVTPPDLTITTRPRGLTLTGLPTYFTAAPPATLGPVPFGGPTVTETISIRPVQVQWQWGDGTESGWLPAGDTATHAYRKAGRRTGTLTTSWAATYTVTYAGRTFGPYDADSRLRKQQPFTKRVATSRPILVS
jgi:hypothetical protein